MQRVARDADAAAGAGGGRVHGPGQRVAAVPGLADHGALVRWRAFLVAVAGAAAGTGATPSRCGARRCAKAATRAVRADVELLRAGFRRPRARHLAEHRAAVDDDLGRGLGAVVAAVRRRRHRDPAAGDPRLHVLVLPRVQRQGRRGFAATTDENPRKAAARARFAAAWSGRYAVRVPVARPACTPTSTRA